MQDLFKDPSNVDEIKEQIINCPTVKDVIEIINNVYPYWLVNTIDDYSEDYPHLTKNWEIICEKFQIQKQKIIVVEDIVNDSEHKLVKFFADYFTSVGCIVRTKCDIIPCIVCNRGIPNEEIYSKMKELEMNIPEKWLAKCVNC